MLSECSRYYGSDCRLDFDLIDGDRYSARRVNKRSLMARSVLSGATGAAFLAVANFNPAMAGPQGGLVVGGSVVITGEGTNSVRVDQSSQRAIINWRSYSIGVDESVRYNQPNANAISLNRVTGGDPSQILGSLIANGQVWLINPAGVLFGESARVDVGGVLATTTNIGNDSFMAGVYNFDEASTDRGAVVLNKGQISAADGGMAAFVAPGVGNSGVISANLGRVELASGDAFSFDLYGDALVHLTASAADIGALTAADGTTLTARVVQDGSVLADGGRVRLSVQSARALVDNSINMSGHIQARAVSQQGGSIVLSGSESGVVEITGTIDASGRAAGQVGGSVKLLGHQVGLFDGAQIDASGDAGGGEVLIGGNYLGRGPEQNASATVLASGATVAADALVNGDGGRVIVWSDDYTAFYGDISVKGGLLSGDGGFVETSSKRNLQAFGRADASAVSGQGGTWLLDPENVNITGATANGGFGGGNPDTFTPTAGASTIDAAAINALLDAGTSVIVITTEVSEGAVGTITVTSAIAKTGGAEASLTLTAGGGAAAGQIDINNTITSTSNELNLILTSRGEINFGANIALNGGDLTVSTSAQAAVILQSAGTITAAAATSFATGGGAITVANASNDFTGVVTASNTGENLISLRDTNALILGAITTANTLTVVAGGTISLQGDLAFDADLSIASAVVVNKGGAVGINTGDNDITFGSTLALNSAADDLTITAGGGDVTFTGVATIAAGDLTIATSDVAVVTGGIVGSTGDVTFTTTTRTDVDGAIALSGNGFVQLDATTISHAGGITTVGGLIDFDNAVIIDTGAGTVIGTGGSAAGDVVFDSTLALATAADDLTIFAGIGDVTFTGVATIGDGDLTIASGGIVTVTGGITGDAGVVDITANSVPSGAISNSTNVTISANQIGSVVVTTGTALLEADNTIINAAIVATNVTVRGNNSVKLINTTAGGHSGNKAWRSITLKNPFGTGGSFRQGLGNLTYTVNSVPFGPSRALLSNAVNQSMQNAGLFDGSNRLYIASINNNDNNELDRAFSTAALTMQYVFDGYTSPSSSQEIVTITEIVTQPVALNIDDRDVLISP